MAVIRSITVRYVVDMGNFLRAVDKAAEANDRLADKTEAAGKRIDRLAVAGGVVAAGIGLAVAKFAEFDSAMSAAAAASGATGDQLDALRTAAIAAGKDTQYSATEAAEAITELSKAGVSAADILGGGLQGSLALAAAGQLDVGKAAEIAATALTQFKLKGSQVGHVADLLAAGAGNAQGSVEDMGNALGQAGLVASQTGLSVEETTAGLTAFAAAGMIGSDAGTSFKSMLQRLTPTSEEAAGLMEELGISAYDAQGNFIGLEKFAGNLREAMKDLTPEQRNAAMATIFGSDAVRAASVLYNEGADGIAGWTTKVTEAGYAGRQAAELTNNLKGDLERLGGTLDTVLIQTGSEANTSLRTVVQTLEGLVEMIGAVPGPAVLGAASLTALALVGPKLNALGKTMSGPVAGGMARFRDEMRLQQTLGAAASRTYDGLGDSATRAGTKVSRAGTMMGAARVSRGGLRGAAGGLMGLMGGPLGIAITGATVALTAFATANQNAKDDADALAATVDTMTGKFTQASSDSVIKKIMGDVSTEDLTKLEQLGINLQEGAEAALAGGPAFEAYNAQVRATVANNRDAWAAADGYMSSLDNQQEAAARARADLDLLARATGGAAAGAQANAAAQDLLRLATMGVVEPTEALYGATDGLGVSMELTKEQAKALEEQQKLLRDAMVNYGAAAMGADAATAQLEAAYDDARKAAEENGKTVTKNKQQLDLTTDAGRKNQAALQDIAKAADEAARANLRDGDSVDSVKGKMGKAREEFIISAGKMGMLKGAAERLADQYGLTAGSVDNMSGELEAVPSQVISNIYVKGVEAAVAAAARVDARLAAINDRTVTISTIYKTYGQSAALAAQQDRRFGVLSAAGNIVHAYAGGGFNMAGDVANGHVPAIYAPSGTVRAFAEPETRGEAYTPLANDWRRPRAKRITEQVATMFGGRVEWNAAGSISRGISAGSTGLDYGRLAKALGSRGSSLTVNAEIHTEKAEQVARDLETRFRDAMAVYHLGT